MNARRTSRAVVVDFSVRLFLENGRPQIELRAVVGPGETITLSMPAVEADNLVASLQKVLARLKPNAPNRPFLCPPALAPLFAGRCLNPEN